MFGMANGEIIFTLEINPETGEYEFTLLGPLDHADGTDPNDIIELNFGALATDGDGDTVAGTITVSVADDGPSIEVNPVMNMVDEIDGGTLTVDGIFLADFGNDDQAQ